GETQGEFRGRVRDAVHERRDLEMEKLRGRYGSKLASLQEQIRKAEQRVEREQSQYKQQKFQTAVSVGATILGALFGRKLGSVGKATTAARGAGRAAREKGDIDRAEETVEALREKLAALEAELQDELDGVKKRLDSTAMELEELSVAPRKTDLAVDRLALAWTPWRVDATGIAEPMFDA
ncbi:MAG: ATP-binding protein, partial [Planctomycetota bacterium]